MSLHSKTFFRLIISILFLTSASFSVSAKNMDDISQRRILGFSPSGDYFAFQEFGKNPGSGYAYANIYVINTVRNKWVKGSPFRVKPSEGIRSRKRARRRVERKAKRMLRRFGIQRKRVRILASNPITELNNNKMRVKVNPRVSISEVTRPMIFSIDQFRIRTPRHCRGITNKRIKGLIIRVKRVGERRKQLHRDKKIPKSRGCPVSYTISDVIQLKKPSSRGAVYAVIYSIIRQGRYGMERRFIGGGYHDEGDRRDPDYYDDNNEYGDYDTPYEYQTSGNDDYSEQPTRNAGYRPEYGNGNSNNDNYSNNSNDDRYGDRDNRENRWDDEEKDTGYNYKRGKKSKNSKSQRRR